MQEPKDKRTKEWKEWNDSQFYKDYAELFDQSHKDDSKGLGDTIAKVTKATGIDKAVKWVVGDNCGCEERIAKANKKYKYRQVECPTEAQVWWMREFFKEKHPTVTHEEQKMIVEILNHSFGSKHKPTKCGSCVDGWINQLNKLFESS